MEDDYLMEIKTVQAGAIKVLVEALKELLTDTVIEVDSMGLRVVAMDVSHVVLVHLRLHASKFEYFSCAGPLQLGVNMLNLYKIIRTLCNSDTLTLYVEKNNVNYLGLRIDNQDKNTRTSFKLSLLDLDGSTISVQPSQFNSVITLLSTDFQKICRDMHQISDLIEIKRVGSDLIFRTHKAEACSQETIISDSRVRQNPEAEGTFEDDEIMQGIFSLKYLTMFTRCSALSQTVDIYLKNDYPFIVVYSVASLGSLKLCCAPAAV